MWHTNLKDPVCPEHDEPMLHELQQNWWRGACGCQIRVFEEDRKAYVPATALRWVSALHGHRFPQRYGTIWLPLESE
jgi:hypothetical protein